MKRIALLAPLLLALAACDTFYAEAEQPLVCLTLPEQSYTFLLGPGPIVGPWEGDFAWNVDLGIANALPNWIISSNPSQNVIQFVSFGATLATNPPTASFNWLQSLTLTVQPTSGSEVTVAQYSGGLPPGARSFNLGSSNPGFNLITALQNGQVQLTMRGHASVPAGSTIPASWTGSVNACVSARIKKTLADL